MKKNNIISFLIILIILIIITIATFCIKNITNSKSIQIGEDIKLTNNIKKELYNKVKNDITNLLKSPSSAVFPNIKEWTFNVNSNNIVEVKSYVDSQNSYGAMLRANYMYQYILSDGNEYICIYKEFDNEVQFDITENAENKKVINKKITEKQINDFINKTGENKYNTLYNKTIDYNFNEATQQLEWNVIVNFNSNDDLKYYSYLALTSAIDECICIPTVKTTINIYTNINEQKQKVATVKDIDFEFMMKRWNILGSMGITTPHKVTDFEEDLGENLIQEDIIKNMKADYWNK